MKNRQYDLTLIIKGDKTAEEALKIFEDIKAKLEKIGFQIEKTFNPVLKDMAYEIDRFKQGYYATFIFASETFSAKDLQEIFKFDENILRYLAIDYSDGVGLRKQKHDRRTRKYQDAKEGASALSGEDKTLEPKEELKEEPKEEVLEAEKTEEKPISEEINQPKEESTAQKQIDLESLDEKLDELLK